MRRATLTFLLLVLFIGVWQLVASLPGVDRLILASPGETARALGSDRSLLLDNAWTTLEEALLGLAIAVVFGALDSITRASMQEWLAGALADEPRTLVLVTHDVEEALYLADRVAVMSPRPGRIVAQLDVPFARPRTRRRDVVTSPEFADLREQAMEALGQ